MPDLPRDDYLALRHPRYGKANPERIDNPLWQLMIRDYVNITNLRETYTDPPRATTEDERKRRAEAPRADDREGALAPLWTFQRSGQARVKLPDGRTLAIGGWHWDYRGPDTCIFNDVLVEMPDRSTVIYGYPRDVFPPLRGHSATLVGNAVFIVGGVGYDDLSPGEGTAVFRLDAGTMAITAVPTRGDAPGRVFDHGAMASQDGVIALLGGEVRSADGVAREPNAAIFELDLASGLWRRLADDERSFLGASMADYRAWRGPRYGTANPERIEAPIWEKTIRDNLSGYGIRCMWGDRGGYSRDYPGRSNYRESENGPVWSWARFGQSITEMPDGRKIYIAGEHEDAYDPDFCIYNDVVVELPDGQLEIYAYPKNVFPPTDFHSATLIDGDIVLIGSLGYMDMRIPGTTQVFRLDTDDYRMSPIVTTGDAPGWLFRHSAETLPSGDILVFGGEVQVDSKTITRNEKMFALSPQGWRWREVSHGDTSVFPVSMAQYQAGKNPRFGRANPELITEPFWLEMLRSRWTPARARLHFGDPGRSRPDRDDPEYGNIDPYGPCAIDNVVWTAVRNDVVEMMFSDGTRISIAGSHSNFGDDWCDTWDYNDIIVARPDGSHEIYAYPADVFPCMIGIGAIEVDGQILIFGRGQRASPYAQVPMAYALDPATFSIAPLGHGEATRPATLTHAPQRDGDRIRFVIMKQRRGDPDRWAWFDPQRKIWLKPSQ